MAMDRASVYSFPVLQSEYDESHESNTQIERQFAQFILTFKLGNSFVYRDQLQENVLIKRFCLDVDVAHLISFSEELADALATEPAEKLPLFEAAAKECAKRILIPTQSASKDSPDIPEIQVTLSSSTNETKIRDLTANSVSKLVRVPGIIIGASTLSSKATSLRIQCRGCNTTTSVPINSGFSGVTLPRVCNAPKEEGSEKCPLDPYFILHEQCRFIDQQVLKLQEAPDQVPVGELPRHVLLSADRYLTNRVIPGSRCKVVGIFSIYQNKGSKGPSAAVAIRTPYLRVVGIEVDVDHTAKGSAIFSEEEEQEFLEMSRNPNLYEVFANSIAPSIYGNPDIKKAIVCLLMGGSKKILPDGMKLRGDINVLLLGDPGTAKSQLLKFVEKVSPIAIYTSGKGSSAAGLTASVQRDAQSREFYLEGGAMVLGDGGVVCIDEFDKMRDEDRVAIHEAMEQQTISIAKAGITTILNARTSVLAAANPIFGRYDDMKSAGDNIDFQTTILSRFDMIFIVKDEHDTEKDRTMARHVIGIHMNRDREPRDVAGEIPIDKMKRYITYCKTRCAPTLSQEAAERLSSHFVSIRKQVHKSELDSNERSSIPITVRQLEAIIRITESLAKLTLSSVATEAHVEEAIRLFMASTMNAVSQGSTLSEDVLKQAGKIEDELRKRLPIGWTTSVATLRKEMVTRREYTVAALDRALQVMSRREAIQFKNQGAQIVRIGV
ncbi:minichromosome maintenance protein 5 [Orbilia oligospora]|uniref:DNA replication licensing factor MCM5 n=2 Tax=Orbilia oligospora TaxID=2813651 RepID=A0A7C8KAJ9_ORBOL|nr:minichromosome maintenance protein 5 [Orbilia oligospora]KAF3182580.1 minichromosome maintenance protein 5 [Orbilia oligospora]KAF3232969.1 minichromosome maintenance protein 5 [Orbilia oligospora]KAF3235533.1 minichromosome maintenance protein 5 [Orbilia oligospora]KAF3298402.1 minichromosome maintenance protein 5 [Orbilia oligospora]